MTAFQRDRYDVVIAGARCAGAATALLLARSGLRVLVVDPLRYGSDTLSTHALMRGAVLQLHRWGLLDEVRSSGAPPVRSTTFHYGDETIEVLIKPRDGVDALYAPRRTVLDPVLVDAARESGAEFAFGASVTGLVRDREGRVRGATVAHGETEPTDILADLVIGADGIRSRVARVLDAPTEYETPHAACSIYGYWQAVPMRGYHWFYDIGVSIGTIPTNDGDTCVFALLPQALFMDRRDEGIATLFHEAVAAVSPELAEHVRTTKPSGKLRAFPGYRGFLRRAVGPGWALVGDAAYFRDPITAHGITDALREAELLSHAIVGNGGDALSDYQSTRDERVRGLLDVTDRIASFDWDLEEAKEHHLELNRQMKAQVEVLRDLYQAGADPPTAAVRA
ncbi:MAG TPA: NAD(P)/FAD-dependent oxidoreductase [Longimicrobiales bacterium]|nr:NAD(P)/FAD-dependent oxidoreductase [Longimicrobiales bacterium]